VIHHAGDARAVQGRPRGVHGCVPVARPTGPHHESLHRHPSHCAVARVTAWDGAAAGGPRRRTARW